MDTKKIPTAEVVLLYLIPEAKKIMSAKQWQNAIAAIQLHSKYYVKEALAAAAEDAEIDNHIENYFTVNKKSILNSYPESKIK